MVSNYLRLQVSISSNMTIKDLAKTRFKPRLSCSESVTKRFSVTENLDTVANLYTSSLTFQKSLTVDTPSRRIEKCPLLHRQRRFIPIYFHPPFRTFKLIPASANRTLARTSSGSFSLKTVQGRSCGEDCKTASTHSSDGHRWQLLLL